MAKYSISVRAMKPTPIYYDDKVKRVLKNAVKWSQPEGSRWIDSCPCVPADQAPNPIEVKGEGLHKPW